MLLYLVFQSSAAELPSNECGCYPGSVSGDAEWGNGLDPKWINHLRDV